MKNFSDIIDGKWLESKEKLVEMLQNELEGRNSGEDSEINVINDISALIIGYLQQQSLTHGGEVTEFMRKKAQYAARTVAEGAKWDSLARKMMKLKEKGSDINDYEPFEPEKVD